MKGRKTQPRQNPSRSLTAQDPPAAITLHHFPKNILEQDKGCSRQGAAVTKGTDPLDPRAGV